MLRQVGPPGRDFLSLQRGNIEAEGESEHPKGQASIQAYTVGLVPSGRKLNGCKSFTGLLEFKYAVTGC